jgi:hypothetical protein
MPHDPNAPEVTVHRDQQSAMKPPAADPTAAETSPAAVAMTATMTARQHAEAAGYAMGNAAVAMRAAVDAGLRPSATDWARIAEAHAAVAHTLHTIAPANRDGRDGMPGWDGGVLTPEAVERAYMPPVDGQLEETAVARALPMPGEPGACEWATRELADALTGADVELRWAVVLLAREAGALR